MDTPAVETLIGDPPMTSQQEQIERLTRLLQDAENRAAQVAQAPPASIPNPNELADALRALTHHLTRADSPAAPAGPSRSTKIPDPPILTDGKDPSFESWKLQMQDKLEVNVDHYPTRRAKMAYVFGRTGGDAQAHLRPRY